MDLKVANPIIRVEEIKDEIETFYDLLEKEVLAKKYVDQYKDETGISINRSYFSYTCDK